MNSDAQKNRPRSRRTARGKNQMRTQANTMNIERFSTNTQAGSMLQALAGLLASSGFSLTQLADGSYLVCRWGYARALSDLHAVRQFVKQIRGQQ